MMVIGESFVTMNFGLYFDDEQSLLVMLCFCRCDDQRIFDDGDHCGVRPIIRDGGLESFDGDSDPSASSRIARFTVVLRLGFRYWLMVGRHL